MTVDHCGLFFALPGSALWQALRGLGRLAFPLFAFCGVEGVFKSRQPFLYGLRVLVSGLLLDLAFYLFSKTYTGNSFVELGLGIFALALIELKNRFSFLAVIPMAVMVLADFSFFPIRSEYGTTGLLIMAGFYLAKYAADFYCEKTAKQMGVSKEAVYTVNGRLVRNLFSAFALFVVELLLLAIYFFNTQAAIFTSSQIPFALEQYAALAGLIIIFYNGKKGYSNKWVNWSFYVYYPLHLVILYGIYLLVG
jgi:hypothetical protein